MILHALGLAAGLFLLVVGADALVRGSARLARAVGVNALIVGLTIVAFGTSLPELLVSLIAALRGQADISLGNVVGSNIFNVTLIVGVSALIRPIAVQRVLVRVEIPIMLAVSIGVVALLLDASIARGEGWLLCGGLVVYVGSLAFRTLRDPSGEHPASGDGPAAGTGSAPAAVDLDPGATPGRAASGPRTGALFRQLGLVAIGTLGLVAGARLLVDSAVGIGRLLEMSDRLIGLTIVAAGTSLPELATSLVAAVRREADIAIGNVVGSNVFNLLGIVGVSATLRPLDVQPSLLAIDLPALLASSLLLFIACRTGHALRRLEGAVLLAAYIGYVTIVLLAA